MNLPIVGWNEALICYVLAAGSAKHAIDAESYHSGWARNGAIANGNEYMGSDCRSVNPLADHYSCRNIPFARLTHEISVIPIATTTASRCRRIR